MCRRITCPSCGKPSFAGCGRHVEQVLGDVPPAERCQCPAPAAGPGLLAGAFKRLAGIVGGGRTRKRP